MTCHSKCFINLHLKLFLCLCDSSFCGWKSTDSKFGHIYTYTTVTNADIFEMQILQCCKYHQYANRRQLCAVTLFALKAEVFENNFGTVCEHFKSEQYSNTCQQNKTKKTGTEKKRQHEKNCYTRISELQLKAVSTLAILFIKQTKSVLRLCTGGRITLCVKEIA